MCIFSLVLLQLEPDRFYVHEVTLVFLQRGTFQLDVKSMTPNIDDDNQGVADDPRQLDRRTGRTNEAALSRSPIKKVSQHNFKNRPSLQQKNEGSADDSTASKVEDSRGGSSSSDGSQGSKGKNLSQNSKKLPALLPKKPKLPTAAAVSQAAATSNSTGSNKRPVSGSGSTEDTNSRTSSIEDEMLSVLPSTCVARMVSKFESRSTPPPVPTSPRPKLKSVMGSTNRTVDPLSAMTVNDNGQFTKKIYPTINGSSALAKPVPLFPINPTSSGGNPSSASRGLFTTHIEEKQDEPVCQEDGSTASNTTTTKGTKSSTKRKRLNPKRMESVVLLSSHSSRSQNLWNARLQSSVRLLSGPHFTFNVT